MPRSSPPRRTARHLKSNPDCGFRSERGQLQLLFVVTLMIHNLHLIYRCENQVRSTFDESSEDEWILDVDAGSIADTEVEEEGPTQPKKRMRFNSTTTNVEGGTGAASTGDSTESDTDR